LCLFSGTSVTGSGIDHVIKLVAVLLFIQGPQTQISSMCGNVKSYPVFNKEKQGFVHFPRK
jgi:hypothetical protein